MDIGIQEVLLIAVIALVVLGPERLPVAIKTIAIWVNRIKRSFNEVKAAVEKEIDADNIRRHIHNENVLHELGETRQTLNELEQTLNSTATENSISNNHNSDTNKTATTSSSVNSPDH